MNYKFDKNRVFFTSDTHFNHANIIKFCNRPFKNVDEMNEALITNWNKVVSADDYVFHLGDFCLGGSAEWTKALDCLNGKIFLILGNHDLKNLKQGFIGRFEKVAYPVTQRLAANHCRKFQKGGNELLRGDGDRYGQNVCVSENYF